MKKINLLLATVSLVFSVNANSQNLYSKPVVCFSDFASVLKRLSGYEYDETPIWRGKNNDQGNNVVLLYNEKTTAWTLIEYKNNQGCVLSHSDSSEFSVRVKVED